MENGPVAAGAAAPCRGCGAEAPRVNPWRCDACLALIPLPGAGMEWQERLPGRLHALTGGETPAAFGCLLDAAVPVRPLALGTSTAFAARYPGRGRAGGDFLHSYWATCGYLSAVAAEGAERFDLDGRPVAAVSKVDRERAAAWVASPWVSGNRADREAYREARARAGQCTMEGPYCMVTADGGPMGRLRMAVPVAWCGAGPARVAAGGGTRRRAERFRGGPWAVVGLDRRGVERYRVSGYGDEAEAAATLEFHPAGTALTYTVRLEGRAGSGEIGQSRTG